MALLCGISALQNFLRSPWKIPEKISCHTLISATHHSAKLHPFQIANRESLVELPANKDVQVTSIGSKLP